MDARRQRPDPPHPQRSLRLNPAPRAKLRERAEVCKLPRCGDRPHTKLSGGASRRLPQTHGTTRSRGLFVAAPRAAASSARTTTTEPPLPNLRFRTTATEPPQSLSSGALRRGSERHPLRAAAAVCSPRGRLTPRRKSAPSKQSAVRRRGNPHTAGNQREKRLDISARRRIVTTRPL